jgi:glutamate/tyrosine decarboxylase-like PLP-dependent enzyme
MRQPGEGPTTARYDELLTALRKEFPQPVSDPVHDAYMVFSILRALDQVDGLKSDAPILGRPVAPDWDAARASRIEVAGRPLEQVVPELVSYLEGMFIWGHPRCQVHVVPPPSIASIIGVLLPSMYNPNLCSEDTSRRVAEAELRVASMTADLIGWDPERSGGVFTFGGTAGLLYGIKVGLEKAAPGSMLHGLRDDVVVLASDESHYSVLSAAGWLGLGQQSVVRVATGRDNAVRIDQLEEAARRALSEGKKLAAIVATLGTTDAFGLDDLEAIHALRERLVGEFALPYRPHIHADAAIGWAWSVFADYDFAANPLGFRGRTVRALAGIERRVRHLKLADSVSLDFHKTGFAPYVSSLVLMKERGDFSSIARPRETMPYLYQSGVYNPGMFTMETSRSGAGPLAALANLLLLGKDGLRVLLGHAVDTAEVLREAIEAHPDLTVLNADNPGPVTLFRVYPHGVDTYLINEREENDPAFRDRLLAHNRYNRRIYERVHAEALAGRGVAISSTECYRHTEYGEPIVALKSYVLSPFANEAQARSIVDQVLSARAEIEASPDETVAAGPGVAVVR